MLGWSDEDLFKLLNGVLPAWALLLLAPRWRGTGVVVKVTALVYSVMYVATLVASTQSPDMAGSSTAEMFTFEGVAKLLGTRSAVLPAWTHYVVFDLWTAWWELQDAQRRAVPQVLMALPISFTMMAGPSGLLLYMLLIRPFFRAPLGSDKED